MSSKIKFLGNSSVNKKGQIVIPLDARKSLGLGEKDKLLFFSGFEDMGFIAIKEDALSDFMNEINNELTSVLQKQKKTGKKGE